MRDVAARDRAKELVDRAARQARLTLNRRATSPTRGRLVTMVCEIAGPVAPDAPIDELLPSVHEYLADGAPERVWFAHAVLRGELPVGSDVVATRRAIRLDGPQAGVRDILEQPSSRYQVDVVQDAVLVDLEHTSATDLATGIQRVARETTRRWAAHHDICVVGWNREQTGLRVLTEHERRRALGMVVGERRRRRGSDDTPSDEADGLVPDRVVVPGSGTYVLPELAVDRPRTERIQALAQYSGLQTAVIGFDCVPITSAETTGGGMGSAFAGNLAAVREMDRVATISQGAATEYRGWRAMLGGAGLPGPAVEPVVLPVEATTPDDDALGRGRDRLTVGSLPMVLCVGSHEPRKNHLAVLHAAELCWRKGSKFNLVFVGGNAWNSERFTSGLQRLQSAGYPVESVKALSDPLLWAAYRLARCVVFPSLNEGFGLPVAEALASGTPVITSDFGSMAEIAEGGGALLVDPRDDHALADALQRLVDDDDEHARLVAEARARPIRTWDEYAAESWAFLVEGRPPTAG